MNIFSLDPRIFSSREFRICLTDKMPFYTDVLPEQSNTTNSTINQTYFDITPKINLISNNKHEKNAGR